MNKSEYGSYGDKDYGKRGKSEFGNKPKKRSHFGLYEKIAAAFTLALVSFTGGGIAKNMADAKQARTEAGELVKDELGTELQDKDTKKDPGISSLDEMKQINEAVAANKNTYTDLDYVLSERNFIEGEKGWYQELSDEHYIVLGEVEYNGPMKVSKLSAVGPDGKEFFTEVDMHGPLVMLNPIIDITRDGLSFSGLSENGVIKVDIKMYDVMKATTSGGPHVEPLSSRDDHKLIINGQDLYTGLGYEYSDRDTVEEMAEATTEKLEKMLDPYLAPVLGVSSSPIQLPSQPYRGDTDAISRGEIKVGELLGNRVIYTPFNAEIHTKITN